jgi:hypothetical protein
MTSAATMAAPWCLWTFFEETVRRSRLPGGHAVALAADDGLPPSQNNTTQIS